MNLNDTLNHALHKSDIDETYYPDIHRLIKKSQANLKSKNFIGTAGEGLLTVYVNNKGIIEKLAIADSLICQMDNNFNETISNLCKMAHTEAFEKVEEAYNQEMEILDSGIRTLLADGTYE